jgi:nucleoside-diphosphate-sugar epimerase
LQKGIDEVRATIKEQSKEVAEYMAKQETEDKVTYKSTIIGVCVHRVDADHRTLQTEVRLEDEGGGEFITLTDTDGSQIRLDFEEFDEVVKAVALLKGQGGTAGALEALDRLYRENGEGMKRLAAQ